MDNHDQSEPITERPQIIRAFLNKSKIIFYFYGKVPSSTIIILKKKKNMLRKGIKVIVLTKLRFLNVHSIPLTSTDLGSKKRY